MAVNTVPQLASSVNENSTISLDFLNGNTPVVSSLHISQHFNKKHKNVLREINDLRSNLPESFRGLNFEPTFAEVPGPNGAVRKIPAFLLTRDAFSLLVMGFTGAQALKWKLKYIEAFNALEKSALENMTELARESGYAQGLTEARSLPAVRAQRQSAYLSGMKEGAKIQKRKDGLTRLGKIVGYLQKGLTQGEIARILGVRRQFVSDALPALARWGCWHEPSFHTYGGQPVGAGVPGLLSGSGHLGHCRAGYL